MKVFFLSDLHLENGGGAAAKRFISFLEKEPQPEDLLILGGDIFDLLVGDKRIFRARYKGAVDALIALSRRGTTIFYLEGNHDFHFGAVFAGEKISVRTEDFEIHACNHRIWVSHGDLIDRTDKGYLLLRAFTRNRVFKAFVAGVPDIVVDAIGNFSSQASRKYTTGRVESGDAERIRNLYLEFAKSKVREGYRHVLVGHSHLKDQIAILDSGKRGEYVNLGFSAKRLAYAVLEDGADSFRLKELG